MASSEAAAPAVARRCLRERHIERGRAKRGRYSPLTPVLTKGSSAAGRVEGVRPTVDERAAAEHVIAAIATTDKGGLKPPLLDQRAAAPKPHVVALALALYFGQEFASEAKAKLAFGVGKGTDVGKGTAWQRTLARLFEHCPASEAKAAACFKLKPTAAKAAKTPLLTAPTPAVAHHTPPTALAGAGGDLEWQWWRRGFDAARAEQADQVQAAAAAAIAAAEERAATAERMRDQAWEEQQKCEEMLGHVVCKYLLVSDGKRRAADMSAAHERARAEQAEAACEAYEEAFDNFCWEQHTDLDIDSALYDEREKLFDARAHAMARARQRLPQQPEESIESSPWGYLFCGDWFDVLHEETVREHEREAAERERERENALSVLRAPGSAPGGC